jgi:hypothetical protein
MAIFVMASFTITTCYSADDHAIVGNEVLQYESNALEIIGKINM